MQNLTELFVFAEVVDRGGFTAAARSLGLPKSTVSKRVAELERRLGARLIARTSRRFGVTDLGREVHAHARAMIAEAEAAAFAVERRRAAPMGVVKLTAAATTCQSGLTGILPGLAERYPAVQVVLHATNRYVDLVQEGFDLAVRAHYRPLDDLDLFQRRLGTATAVLVASPDYLRHHGAPESPENLSGHHALHSRWGASDSGWVLYGPKGAVAEVRPVPRMVSDEPSTVLGAALAGLGVASLPLGLCRPQLEAGSLLRILPAWTAGRATLSLLSPHKRGDLPSVRAVSDYLAERLPAAMTLEP
ncbi:LysR family transcriptional regulator [Inquilinus limosus]|uniref:LysR substrate-binding domain-containing protein n=1 Tax=Inquilinus limosus TaxID=171674 RepID=UPI003F16BE87